ncbi:MAG: RidA family protein [Chloroflexi bacterium]|nr:RidA family protein [Chloroflexota bacterium]
MNRQQVSSGAEWEQTVGYSRAVRVGNIIHVAGTTAVGPDGRLVALGDPYAQAQRIFEIIGAALAELGAGWEHVTRTRIYLVNPEDWQAVGRAHGEIFSEIRPASTMLAVRALLVPEMLVEIEVDAVV